MSKKAFLIGVCLFMVVGVAFAQNETSKPFVKGTVLATQAGSSLNKFPKLEIGFVGRNAIDTSEPTAFLFFRLQSTMETGGGIFFAYFDEEGKQEQENSVAQFMKLLAHFTVYTWIADDDDAVLEKELGEIELIDFQWYMTENQWKSNTSKRIRIKIKAQTVNGEHRLYFYRTSSIKDKTNEFYTFTMPNDTYLTESQCEKIARAYGKEGFVTDAIRAAVNSVGKTIR